MGRPLLSLGVRVRVRVRVCVCVPLRACLRGVSFACLPLDACAVILGTKDHNRFATFALRVARCTELVGFISREHFEACLGFLGVFFRSFFFFKKEKLCSV